MLMNRHYTTPRLQTLKLTIRINYFHTQDTQSLVFLVAVNPQPPPSSSFKIKTVGCLSQEQIQEYGRNNHVDDRAW